MTTYTPMNQRPWGTPVSLLLLFTAGTVASLIFLAVTDQHTHTVNLDTASKTALNGVQVELSTASTDAMHGMRVVLDPSSPAVLDGLNVTVSNDGVSSVGIADGPNLDAFSRLRVSGTSTIFDSKQIAEANTLIWNQLQTSGSGATGAFNANQASYTLSVSDSTAGTFVRQSKTWHPYQPGKSQLVLATGALGVGASGITSRIGLFNAENGLFFECADAIIYVARRSFVTGVAVDTRFAQSVWNLDKMDGTGPSGNTIDVSKAQIFVIDFQWLGVGRIRWGLDMNGVIVYVHEERNDNKRSVVYMSNPNLPVRYEISNNGTGPAASMTQICSMVSSEGGTDFTGITRTLSTGRTGFATLNTASTSYVLLALRLKAAHLHGTVVVRSHKILCTTSSDFFWAWQLNPTLTGVALTWVDMPNSAFQYAMPANANRATVTDANEGTVLTAAYEVQGNNDASSGNTNLRGIRLGSYVDGTPDVLVLTVTDVPVGAETFYMTTVVEELI